MQQPVPERPHLATLVADFRRHGPQTAVISRKGLRECSFTYSDLADLAGRFGAELEARGLKKGDRVLIWGENSGQWIAAFFGCILRGVIAVPVDFASSPSFANRVVREVAPRLAVGSWERMDQLEAGLEHIAFEDFQTLVQSRPIDDAIKGLTETDQLQIVFTSGTSGEPKGVVHTHRNVLASLRPIEREMQKYLKYERVFHPLRFLHTLPLSHVFGQFMGMWIPALLAAEVYFATNLLASETVQVIRRERISVLITVPRVLEIFRTHLLNTIPDLAARLERARELPAWKRWWEFRDVHRRLGLKFWAVICGGATLPAELERFWAELGFAVIQGYGMTETTALVSLNHPFHLAQGTLGKVLPGREIRLAPDGEILVRGETVSQATWEAGKLTPRGTEWLATGDLAAMDAAGNLRFRGRKKEVIVASSGLNIYPEDLEAALLHQQGIRGAAVVEVSGPSGSEPAAALLIQADHDPAQAVAAANRELAEYQQVRRWMVWSDPDFPRTSTGKVLHRVIRATLQSKLIGQAPSAAAPGSLAAVIGRITGEDVSAKPDSALLVEDLHLDSLGRVHLESELEAQFGVEISDAKYQQIRTLGELRQMVESAAGATVERGATAMGQETVGETHVYPVWPWLPVQSAIRTFFIEVLMRPLVNLLAAPRVVRLNDHEPAGPLLIVANHVTAYDVPLILNALRPKARRKVAVAMAGEMLLDLRNARGQGNLFLNLTGPVQYFLITALFNVFPLPRLGNFRKSFAHAGRAMDRGFHVLIFPEGQRTPDEKMHSFQSGAGMLWKELNATALPVCLFGLAELKTKRMRWFRSRRITIVVGNPLAACEADSPAAAHVLEQAVAELARKVDFQPTTSRDAPLLPR